MSVETEKSQSVNADLGAARPVWPVDPAPAVCRRLYRSCAIFKVCASVLLGCVLFVISIAGIKPALGAAELRTGVLTHGAAGAEIVSTQAQAACTPTIVITALPRYGSFDPLRGTVTCADPAAYRIAPYIFVSGWWTKPTWASPTLAIQPDGSWAGNITTGGTDQYATQIAVFLIPATYSPPSMAGGQTLPSALYSNAIAYLIANRAPSYRTIDFAGFRWRVKASTTPAGPGPNYFSDSNQAVWVDAAGQLHLTISNAGGRWYSTEVINMLSLGYGAYTYTLRGAIDQLDVNAVLGLFTWDDTAPAANYREIDVEFARWGDPLANNAQYVVQPHTTAGNIKRFALTLPGQRSRQSFDWRPGGVYFRTEVEDAQTPGQWRTVQDWTYAGASNPTPSLENPRINFWLMNGYAPVSGLPAEVVVENFEFSPQGTPGAVLNVNRSGTGEGNVAADAPGLDCGLDCAEDYPLGTAVVLTATPQIGSAFLGWQGACTGNGSCAVTLDQSKSVTATFTPLMRLSVTRSGSGGGEVASSDGAVHCGSVCNAYLAQGAVVTLTAGADAVSVFGGWSGGCAGSGSCVLTMSGDKTVNALFNLRTYNLRVGKVGLGGGAVTSQPVGISCGLDCAEAYPVNTVVTLTAAAGPGSLFGGWTGCSGSGVTCTVTVTSDLEVTAGFDLQQAGVSVTRSGSGTGTVTSQPYGIECGVDCTAAFPVGAQVTVTALPAPGSAFTGWSGACTGAEPVCTLTISQPQSVGASFTLTGTAGSRAMLYLGQIMDQYHAAYDIYTDLSAAGNHFAHRAMMGDGVAADESFTATVHSGATAIRSTFVLTGLLWGGWYFQNGTLVGDQVKPEANWGTVPNAGIDLRGATKLTFYARGEKGGERVEFFAFGVGRNPTTGAAEAPYPDSEAKVTICGRLKSPCFVRLDTTWRKYTIDLSGLDLSYVLGAFGWVTNALNNNAHSIAFYLDDIQIDKPRLNEPRFLVSYQSVPSNQDFDTVLRNTAFTYDNAVALMAFAAAGDWERSRLLADAFVYAQQHDRFYSDGRLRNGYQGGDLVLPPGWTPNGRPGTVRMQGWWNATKEHWYEDPQAVSLYVGDNAWALLALLNYYEQRGGDQYLNAASSIGTWIADNTYDTRGAGGYTGGYSGWEPDPAKQLWKSVEHNLDVYIAFSRLAGITNDAVWRACAEHARTFVEAMWNDSEGYYATGTADDGVTVNQAVVPLDTQTWAMLAFGPNPRTLRAMEYAERHHAVTAYGFSGFDFNTDLDQPWFEGTSQAVVAYRLMGRSDTAARYLAELQRVQTEAPHANGTGIVAAAQDGLTTGLNWLYFNRLHVGATAWYVLAELGSNPYWPQGVPSPAVQGFEPTQGPAGTVVTIHGTHLSGTTGVRFAGSVANFAVLSDTSVSATVAAGAASGAIEIETPFGTAVSSQPFTVTPAPPISYELSIALAGKGSGSVESRPSGIDCGITCTAGYPLGTLVTLTAAPAGNSRFVDWSGACPGSDASCTVAMDAAKSVTATFELITYVLTVDKDGDGDGTVVSQPSGIDCGITCTAAYPAGTLVTLTPTPIGNSQFARWSGACSGNGACTLTMDAAKSVTATFDGTAAPVTLTVNAYGVVHVLSSPVNSASQRIDCTGVCSASYESGTEVTLAYARDDLSATPIWSGECSAGASCWARFADTHTFQITEDTLINVLPAKLFLPSICQ